MSLEVPSDRDTLSVILATADTDTGLKVVEYWIELPGLIFITEVQVSDGSMFAAVIVELIGFRHNEALLVVRKGGVSTLTIELLDVSLFAEVSSDATLLESSKYL